MDYNAIKKKLEAFKLASGADLSPSSSAAAAGADPNSASRRHRQRHRPVAALANLPMAVIKRIAHHISKCKDEDDPFYAQQSLAFFALTCKSISKPAASALYWLQILGNLTSLPKFSRAIRSNPGLANHVHGVLLGSGLMDPLAQDNVALSLAVRWKEYSAIPSPARFAQLGSETTRSTLMGWMVHFANLCPELKLVDWSLAAYLHSSNAIGFGNLAQILRQRGGAFFGPPPTEEFAVTAILATDPKQEAKARRGVPYFVHSLDFKRKFMDVFNVTIPHRLIQLILHTIEDVIIGGEDEMRHWRIRNVTLADPVEIDPFARLIRDMPGDYRDITGLSGTSAGGSSYVFDLEKQRMPSGALLLRTPSLTAAQTVFESRGYRKKQCKVLEFMYPPPPFYEDDEPKLFNMFITDQFFRGSVGLLAAVDSPWRQLASLTLGPPCFCPTTSVESLLLMDAFAKAFPNLETLAIHSTYTSLFDLLMCMDVFIRRPPHVGKPLRVLEIKRVSEYIGQKQLSPNSVLESRRNTSSMTQLAPNRATPNHLRRLILMDSNPAGLVQIHPGLLLGLTQLNTRGVRLGILPPHLADPLALSFPFIHRMILPNSPDMPRRLGSAVLPNLVSLAINADLELDAALDDPDVDNLEQLLPTCPRLESLFVDLTQHEYFTRSGFVLEIMDKYAHSLRNLCVANTLLTDRGLWRIEKHRVQFMPRLTRVYISNRYPKELATAKSLGRPQVPPVASMSEEERLKALYEDAIRHWALGELATIWLCDVTLPKNAPDFKLRSGMLHYPPYTKAEAAVRSKGMQPGKACLCGKFVMGKKPQELGSKVWISRLAGEPVCADCVERAECTEEEMKDSELKRWLTKREVVHISRRVGDVQFMLGDGVWGLGDFKVVRATPAAAAGGGSGPSCSHMLIR